MPRRSRLAAISRASVAWMLFSHAAAAAPDAGVAGASPTDSQTEFQADTRTQQIRALTAGVLDDAVSPQSLFDVPLDDEAAIQVEVTRLRAIDAVATREAQRRLDRADEGEPVDAGGSPANPGLDRALWRQRIELDRARLEFYSLGEPRRAELLRNHRARLEASHPREAEAARRAREAEAERARVLEAARAARTEAERLVKEDLARSIALESRIHTLRDGFAAARDQLTRESDTIIGWQRRVQDAKAAGAEETDATYDALRRALRASRDALSAALDALDDRRSDVPALAPDPLADMPPDVATEAARERRMAVAREIAAAREDERALRAARATALLDEISVLNRERLGSLPYLSADKRAATTGFTSAGWDQARAEARHLSLILRYHLHVARTWVATLRGGHGEAPSSWRAAAVLLPLLMGGAIFWWARRRTSPGLLQLDAHLAARDRAERRTSASVERRIVRLLQLTHRPLEWLLFFWLMSWLLPNDATELLEVQLLASAIGWMLAGALVVNIINALAAGSAAGTAPEVDPSGAVRLRSLRLVGRTVVAFALILVLTARLVGQGTIHSWVLSTCWFAAIPVFLLLVRWWRDTVFERIARARRKTPLQSWILDNRAGYKSFLAAILGAIQLFAAGTVKLLRGWLSGFDLARRAHAWLFKREIERIGQEQARRELAPLPEQALERLHPERPPERWISCPADDALAGLVRRVESRRGGLIAIVGARGMGKSSLLREAHRKMPEAAVVACHSQTSLAQLREAVGLSDRDDLVRRSPPPLVLLDDAQAIITPCIGGLAPFDQTLAFARSHGDASVWVFAIDAALWPLLRRARDGLPMFDETHVLPAWNERQIGALLAERCELAGFAPTYEDLLDDLPRGADDVDRQDALHAKKVGYERMLWDHVDGNPALGLEAWRRSLAVDTGGAVHVRPLKVPDAHRLERLPDSFLFVLRAVLQLSPATVEAVARATRLRAEDVLQDVRFGRGQGFFEEHAGGLRVAWPWLRAVMRLLERRHLLVRP
ncbi:MAG TPA: AAA family ATPase [Polyangiaceae bacterium]|nr:AAA family ATPase [Polyangiaceae bacterium]